MEFQPVPDDTRGSWGLQGTVLDLLHWAVAFLPGKQVTFWFGLVSVTGSCEKERLKVHYYCMSNCLHD